MQNEIIFSQNSLTIAQLRIGLSPFKIELINNDNGKTIFRLHTINVRTKEDGWEKITHFEIVEKKHDEIDLVLFANQIRISTLKLIVQNQSISVNLEPIHKNIDWVSIDLNAKDDEHFLGFGEGFLRLW